MPIFDWLKILHISAFVLGLGAAATKFILVCSHGSSNASEELALHITKKLESRALEIAWLLGLILTFLKGEYWSQGWLHAKIVITFLMVGLSHMSAASLRRIGKLRAEAAAAEKIDAAKTPLIVFGIGMGVLALVTFYLVIFQSFKARIHGEN
jgi:uncharacterized membrane protein